MIDYISIGRIDNVTAFCNSDSGVEYKIETTSTTSLENIDDICIMNNFSSFIHDVRENPYGYVLISIEEIEVAEQKIKDLAQANKKLAAAKETAIEVSEHLDKLSTSQKERISELEAVLKVLRGENEKLKKKICDLEADKTAELVLSINDQALIFRRAGTETKLDLNTLQTHTCGIDGGCKIEDECRFNIYSDKLGGCYCSHGSVPVMKCMNADHPCPFFDRGEAK